jgi:hypothetical protein
MQTALWEAFDKEKLGLHTEFLRSVVTSFVQQGETSLFFSTIFDKMHMSLSSIKVEKFRVAEGHLETMKALLEYKEAQEAFVSSVNFLPE